MKHSLKSNLLHRRQNSRINSIGFAPLVLISVRAIPIPAKFQGAHANTDAPLKIPSQNDVFIIFRENLREHKILSIRRFEMIFKTSRELALVGSEIPC